ncbi:MAG: hypothetical protein WDZ76_05380 [Pseudohongiellaceae bacterium]
MRHSLFIGSLFYAMLMLVHSAAIAQAPGREARFGLLVMAHGGSDEWNSGVLEVIEPLRKSYPVAVAFGMADAGSLEQSINKLASRGVTHAGVVRLFVSGESWYERTRQILGLESGAPEKPASAEVEQGAHVGHADSAEGGHSMRFWRITSDIRFAVSGEGLAEADEMGAVLETRARDLSIDPNVEDVLILAHGPEDDAENARWIEDINARAETVRRALPFNEVHVLTLREDWAGKREQAEHNVRRFVQASTEAGREALVIPFRVQGFGPYEDVLSGLDYRADHRGLVPHRNVTRWIEAQARALESRLLR